MALNLESQHALVNRHFFKNLTFNSFLFFLEHTSHCLAKMNHVETSQIWGNCHLPIGEFLQPESLPNQIQLTVNKFKLNCGKGIERRKKCILQMKHKVMCEYMTNFTNSYANKVTHIKCEKWIRSPAHIRRRLCSLAARNVIWFSNFSQQEALPTSSIKIKSLIKKPESLRTNCMVFLLFLITSLLSSL